EVVGQSGVEATYDSLINPGFVTAHVRVDSLGRIAGPLEVPRGKQLPTLKLTIDARLQRAAAAAVEDGIRLSQGIGHHPTGGSAFRNVEAGVYSTMTLHTALAQSCDTWFYRLGDRVYNAAPSRQGMLIQQWARKFGLGSTPPIDITGASPGLIPTPKWFFKSRGFPWTEGQTINL